MPLLVAGLLFGSWLLAWLFPHERVWGLHYFAYLPSSAQAGLLVLGIVGAALAWKYSARLKELRNSLGMAWIVTLGAGLLFLWFAAATALLGDGELWLSNIESVAEINPEARAKPLLRLLEFLYPVLHNALSLNGRTFLQLVSVLSGMVTLLAWLRLGRLRKVPIAVVLLTGLAWGGIALFFGYIEMYPPLIAVVSWMLVLMLSSVESCRKSEAVGAIALGIAAVLLNYLAIVFVPALAAFVFNRFGRVPLRMRPVMLWSGGVLIICGVAYFALGWDHGTDILLSLFPPEATSISNPNARGILSLAQGLDILNALLLLAGPLLVNLVYRRLNSSARTEEQQPGRAIILLALIFPLAGLIVHNAQLGRARDWDIAATFMTIVPVIGIMSWPEVSKQLAPFRVAISVHVAWVMLVIVPWIGVQHSEALTFRRFGDLLVLDPGSSASGWDYLANYHKQRGHLDEWAECNRQALKVSSNPRNRTNLALYYALKRDWSAAETEASLAWESVSADDSLTEWERHVTWPGALLELAGEYKRKALADEAEATFRVATRLAPEDSRAWPWLIGPQIRTGRWDEALVNLQTAGKYCPAAVDTVRMSLNKLLEQSGERKVTGLAGLSLISLAAGDSARAVILANQAVKEAERDSALSEMMRGLERRISTN